jgi:hypothetical protein
VPTARQKAKASSDLRASLERDRRHKDRERLAQVRSHLKHAKRLGRRRVHEVVIACRTARARLRAAKTEARARYLREVAEAQERARLASRTTCEAKKTQVRAQQADRVKRAAGVLEAERAHQRQQKLWARKSPLARKSQRPRAESLQESDSEVERNLSGEDMVRVFRAVRGKIKSTPRRSRTEAFFEWVAEHRPQVTRILEQSYERDVSELVAHEQELRERLGNPRSYRAMSARALSEVPF